jgi:hypothetical protein
MRRRPTDAGRPKAGPAVHTRWTLGRQVRSSSPLSTDSIPAQRAQFYSLGLVRSRKDVPVCGLIPSGGRRPCCARALPTTADRHLQRPVTIDAQQAPREAMLRADGADTKTSPIRRRCTATGCAQPEAQLTERAARVSHDLARVRERQYWPERRELVEPVCRSPCAPAQARRQPRPAPADEGEPTTGRTASAADLEPSGRSSTAPSADHRTYHTMPNGRHPANGRLVPTGGTPRTVRCRTTPIQTHKSPGYPGLLESG